MKIPRRFELLLCSLKRPGASMKMSNFERKYYPGYRHMICFGKKNQQAKKVYLTSICYESISSLHSENYTKSTTLLKERPDRNTGDSVPCSLC